MRGLMLESANDAADDARGGRRGLARGVRAADEPARARSSSSPSTHYANPIGLDAAGNYSSARDLARLAVRAAHATVLPQDRRPHAGGAQQRRPPAHVPQPQHAASPTDRLGQRRSRPATPPAPATCSSARDAPGRRPARLRRARHAERRRARPRHAPRCSRWGLPRFQRITARARAATVAGTRADPLPPRRAARARGRRARVRRIVRAGSATMQPSATSSVPDEVDRADPRAASALGWREVLADGRAVAPRAARRRRRRPGARTSRSAPRTGSRGRSRCCSRSAVAGRYGAAWRGGCGARPGRAARGARSRRPHDPHRHAQHGDRQDARGAELPARPPPPHGGADDDAGRQGRQRRARAQDARRAGDRHRAGRRRDRHAHRRPAHAALRAVATSSASARSRARTPR